MQDNILAVATDERETAWTPGPWRVSYERGTTQIRSADDESLMCDETYYPWVPANDADWHLIAAAPELFDWLEQADEALDVLDVPTDSGLREQIARVLRKARGQS